MKKTVAILALFQLCFTYAQVGIGVEDPAATLDISTINNNTSLFSIRDGANVYIDVTENGVGINQANPSKSLDINIREATRSNISINLNAPYASSGLRLGIDPAGKLIATNYKVGDIIYRNTFVSKVLNRETVVDSDLSVFLTPGTYLIDGIIRYSSTSIRDIKLGFHTTATLTGYFSGSGLYGTFTTTTAALEAVPNIYADIISGLIVMGGEDNNANHILSANLQGIIKVSKAGFVTLRYSQQAGSSNSSTIYDDSFISYERIK
jgi:hypothetical protein